MTQSLLWLHPHHWSRARQPWAQSVEVAEPEEDSEAVGHGLAAGAAEVDVVAVEAVQVRVPPTSTPPRRTWPNLPQVSAFIISGLVSRPLFAIPSCAWQEN